jgi:uncharacterized cupredoxin-like copper-binding protein
MNRMTRMTRMACLAALMAFGAVAASAHGPQKHGDGAKKAISKEEYAWGRQGDPARASRTIEVEMSDAMRFSPSSLDIKAGDTVKFVVRNSGKLMHEMVIGTEPELQKHAEMMRKHPGMEHDEPYMAHVEPGRTHQIAWTFTKPGKFMYGCLIPGHWEAGMKGVINVASK